MCKYLEGKPSKVKPSVMSTIVWKFVFNPWLLQLRAGDIHRSPLCPSLSAKAVYVIHYSLLSKTETLWSFSAKNMLPLWVFGNRSI